jgi:hypothetical protein
VDHLLQRVSMPHIEKNTPTVPPNTQKCVILKRTVNVSDMAACFLLGPRFAGSVPVEGDGFLRAIQIRSTTYFGGEAKPSAPCRKISRHVKNPFEL